MRQISFLLENELTYGCFHCWEDYKDETTSCKFAIVEINNSGKVVKLKPDEITFINIPCGGNMFER